MFWKERPDGLVLALKISPKAAKSEILGVEGEELKLKIAAVPEKGEANMEVVRFLAKALGFPKSQVVLLSGEASRHKKVLLKGANPSILALLGI